MRWLGHACFEIRSPGGLRIITDPFASQVPYPFEPVECDVVTVSHEHDDHNAADRVLGDPVVLRGVDPITRKVNVIDKKIGDVRFETVRSYHDEAGGKQRGENAIFKITLPKLTVVHLGDLGHGIDRSTAEIIGAVDVLLIPVGGYYTIDAIKALAVVSALAPKVVVPMHYKTEHVSSWPIAGVEEFLRLWSGPVRNVSGDVSLFDLPEKTEVWAY